jgi:hypothetical protein
MVSGFFTSPNDQERISSGDAKPIRIESNSSFCPWDFNRLSKSFKAFPPRGFYFQAVHGQSNTPPPRYSSYVFQSFSRSISIARERISLTNTLKDSGMPGSMRWSPSTIFLYIFVRPAMSSDLTVSISCKV